MKNDNAFVTYNELTVIECAQCFRIEVSEHNQIGLLVAKGIEILFLDCSSTTKQLYRRYLVFPTPKFPLGDLMHSPHNQFMWSLNFKSMVEMMLLPESSGLLTRGQTKPTIVDYSFSSSHKNNCYLAILTNLGALDVYQYLAGEWCSVCDVTKLWLDKCTSNWIDPKTWPEWRQQLEQGKPAAICWTKHNNLLYLIVVVMNGDVLLFLENIENKFGLVLKGQVSSELDEPCSVHAFSIGDKICVVVGSFTGQMNALFIDPNEYKLKNSSLVWDSADYSEPKHIVSVEKGTSTYLATSKTHFLLVHSFSCDGPITTTEKNLNSAIVGVSSTADFLFVTLQNMNVVQLSIPSLDVVSHCQTGSSLSQCGACSVNGQIILVAAPSKNLKSRLSVLARSQINPLVVLRERKVSGCLDLLWIHKVSLVQNRVVPAQDDDLTWPKLRYWELQLYLSTATNSNDEEISVIHQRLKNLGRVLREAYAGSAPSDLHTLQQVLTSPDFEEPCVVCSCAIVYSDLHMISCSNGHNVSRCCINLKPCSSLSYSACVLCGAKMSIDNSCPDYFNRNCPFCDGFFRVTTAIL